MFELSNTLIKTIGIYLLVCYGLYQIKHPRMFNENGEFKKFGLNENETITPFWLVTTLVALSSYYLLLIQDGKYVH